MSRPAGCQNVQPDRRGDQAEGEACQSGNQGAEKGRRGEQREKAWVILVMPHRHLRRSYSDSSPSFSPAPYEVLVLIFPSSRMRRCWIFSVAGSLSHGFFWVFAISRSVGWLLNGWVLGHMGAIFTRLLGGLAWLGDFMVGPWLVFGVLLRMVGFGPLFDWAGRVGRILRGWGCYSRRWLMVGYIVGGMSLRWGGWGVGCPSPA